MAISEADTSIETAISAVLAPIGTQLLERFRDLTKQIAPLRAALAALRSEPTGKVGGFVPAEQKPLVELKEAIADFFMTKNVIEHPDPLWQSARLKLRADPNAELPELDALLT
jgi:hypothetical protein